MVGNKADLQERREVDRAEAMEFARRHNLLYLETSAHRSEEVEYAFEVGSRLVQRRWSCYLITAVI